MFENVPKEAYWTLPLIIAILGYFLRDAHRNMKSEIDKHAIELTKKMDEERYNLAEIRKDQIIENLRKDYKEAVQKLDEQHREDRKLMYEQMLEKISNTEKQITNTEKHLSEKFDSLMKYIMDKK